MVEGYGDVWRHRTVVATEGNDLGVGLLSQVADRSRLATSRQYVRRSGR